MKEQSKEKVVETLNRLKLNNDYQLIVNELNLIKGQLEWMIYDENTESDLRQVLIIKRNLIKNLAELPDDLLAQFQVWE